MGSLLSVLLIAKANGLDIPLVVWCIATFVFVNWLTELK